MTWLLGREVGQKTPSENCPAKAIGPPVVFGPARDGVMVTLAVGGSQQQRDGDVHAVDSGRHRPATGYTEPKMSTGLARKRCGVG